MLCTVKIIFLFAKILTFFKNKYFRRRLQVELFNLRRFLILMQENVVVGNELSGVSYLAKNESSWEMRKVSSALNFNIS